MDRVMDNLESKNLKYIKEKLNYALQENLEVLPSVLDQMYEEGITFKDLEIVDFELKKNKYAYYSLMVGHPVVKDEPIESKMKLFKDVLNELHYYDAKTIKNVLVNIYEKEKNIRFELEKFFKNCVKRNKKGVLKYVINSYIEKENLSHYVDIIKNNAMWISLAIKENKEDLIKSIIEKNKNINIDEVFAHACSTQNFNFIKYLVENYPIKKDYIHSFGTVFYEPLFINLSSFDNKIETIQYLKDKGLLENISERILKNSCHTIMKTVSININSAVEYENQYKDKGVLFLYELTKMYPQCIEYCKSSFSEIKEKTKPYQSFEKIESLLLKIKLDKEIADTGKSKPRVKI